MNEWTKLSVEYARQKSYLDDLFRVYPTIPEGIRSVDEDVWEKVEWAFDRQNNVDLINNLFKLKLFPIKDSYIAFLKRDKSAIERNPQTINRICGRLYELGLDKLKQRCSEPKETNRQIGPMFKEWVKRKALGIAPVDINTFCASTNNAVLDASDKVMMDFAREKLGYKRDKGLDFLARFNNKYVVGEAKFLTDFGGHQNAQLNDAISTLQSEINATKVAILDGVLYLKSRDKMCMCLENDYSNGAIMSALVLREFLYQL